MATSTTEKIEPEYPLHSKAVAGSESDIERSTVEVEDGTTFVVDRKLEKKLLWKFDLHILPMLAIMYLFKYVLFIHPKRASTDRRLVAPSTNLTLETPKPIR